MAHTIRYAGVRGEIRWGYHVVAPVADWAFDADATGGDLTGAVGFPRNEYGLTQHPLRFAIPRPKGPDWEWPIDSLQIVDDRLIARLGPPKD